MLSTSTAAASIISPEFFRSINSDVSGFIRQKLSAMDLEVVDLELHNSSNTKTFRAYVTLGRAVNLKTLCVAEKILIDEIERKFAFRPHGIYWRCNPISMQAPAPTSASAADAI